MEIIAHIDVNVNINIEREDAFSLRYGKKWEEKKRAAKITAEKMMRIGEKTRGIRMLNCAEVVSGRVCPSCGQMHIQYANLCRDRFCPVCKWRLSMRRFTSMFAIVTGLRQRYPEGAWQFVTLTCQNCAPADVPDVLDEMGRVWHNITTAQKFKKKVIGWARSIEITFNEVTGLLHPHYHVLLMYKELEEPDEYVIERWCKGLSYKTSVLAQDAQTIEFKANDQINIGWQVDQNPEDDKIINAVLETYKYSTKDKDVENMPLRIFQTLLKALQGRRLVAFGGVIKDYAKEIDAERMDDADDRDEEDIDRETDKCIKCGNSHLIEIIGKWAGDSYIWRRQ